MKACVIDESNSNISEGLGDECVHHTCNLDEAVNIPHEWDYVCQDDQMTRSWELFPCPTGMTVSVSVGQCVNDHCAR
jgi:hypothetical protein